MVYTQDLKSCAERIEGSSPSRHPKRVYLGNVLLKKSKPNMECVDLMVERKVVNFVAVGSTPIALPRRDEEVINKKMFRFL